MKLNCRATTLNNQKPNIRDATVSDLENFVKIANQPSFRKSQIDQWLWQKNIDSFAQMTNLPSELRTQLQQHFELRNIQIHQYQISADKTIKFAFKLPDRHLIESVLIPTENRVTVCISSQVGCSLDCRFCATAKMKRIRNLYWWEIYQQVQFLQSKSFHYFQTPVTNVVFMGMGEPLMNFNNVISSLGLMTSTDGLNMSPGRFTVSTSGIPKLICRLADENTGVNLAVSLHSANQDIRKEIMPFSEKFPLVQLLDSLVYWYRKTNVKITFEYLVLKNVNDTMEDIYQLVDFCKKVPCKVNFIEYNPIEGDRFQEADWNIVEQYQKILLKHNIHSTIRRSRGGDIDAACGQLANKMGVTL